jgi:uncharacterized repeat protein (TIGR03803 family)
LTPPPSAGGDWTEAILYSPTSAYYLLGPLAIGPGGVLYGEDSASPNGGVFSLTPPTSPGGEWTETQLYSFTGSNDGAGPAGGLVIGGGGILYGVTEFGGVNGLGTVFALTPPAEPGEMWTETIIYSFTGLYSEGYPISGLALDKDGVLYGTTPGSDLGLWGTAYSLTPPEVEGSAWIHATIWKFGFDGLSGAYPITPLTVGRDGTLYGTTSLGISGVSSGTAYSLAPPASPGGLWTQTVIHGFTGALYFSGLTIDERDGALYGTTDNGAFELIPPATPGASWTWRPLHASKASAYLGVVRGSNGTLYGAIASSDKIHRGCVFSLKR